MAKRRGGRFKNMGLWGPFHLKRPLDTGSLWPLASFRLLHCVIFIVQQTPTGRPILACNYLASGRLEPLITISEAHAMPVDFCNILTANRYITAFST
jgi:hypothetical protein